jgi:hypothetical protein
MTDDALPLHLEYALRELGVHHQGKREAMLPEEDRELITYSYQEYREGKEIPF